MFEEIVQLTQSAGPTTGLTLRAWIRCEPLAGTLRDHPRINQLETLERWRSFNEGLRHLSFPALSPTVAGLHSSDNTELGDLHPDDPVLTSPGRNTLIAPIRPTIAGFFMAPEALNAELTPGTVQHLHHITRAHHEGLTQLQKVVSQLLKGLTTEHPLPLGGVGLTPELRLHNKQRQKRSTCGGFDQRPVVNNPQITFEPDDLQRCHSLLSNETGSSGWSTQTICL
jgi:hypothetical protein